MRTHQVCCTSVLGYFTGNSECTNLHVSPVEDTRTVIDDTMTMLAEGPPPPSLLPRMITFSPSRPARPHRGCMHECPRGTDALKPGAGDDSPPYNLLKECSAIKIDLLVVSEE